MTSLRTFHHMCATAAILGGVGCAGVLGVVSSPSIPGPTAAPETATAPTESSLRARLGRPLDARLNDRIELEPLDHPDFEVDIDEILATSVLRDAEFRAAVDDWVGYWGGSADRVMPDYLARMGAYGRMVDSALMAGGLPPSLRYLPFIESGYNPRASSRARAVGMWQFMPATAGELGLRVSPLLDERRDPQKSTEAATAFLTELREEFGSWFIALAAYNTGPNRMRRVLARYAPGVPRSDSLFWALRGHFPRETREFLPKLFGAIAVAGNPANHGYRPAALGPFTFDEVSVPEATSLDVIARAAGVTQADIERLNPQYLRGMTPPGGTSRLRVPEGTGAAFAAAYALIPPNERITFVEHRVASGETLSHIAIRYGIRVAELQAANPTVRARALRVGALLTVPVAPSVRNAQAGG